MRGSSLFFSTYSVIAIVTLHKILINIKILLNFDLKWVMIMIVIHIGVSLWRWSIRNFGSC